MFLRFTFAAGAVLWVAAMGSASAEPTMGSDATTDGEESAAPVGHPLPFNPLTFRPPNETWQELRDRRWWAALAAQTVVGLGLVETRYARVMTDTTDALLRRPEINWEVELDRKHQHRFRLQLIARRGRPRLAAAVAW